MYRYNDDDKTLVQERVEQFRDQLQRYLEGQLGEEEFRQLRLRNGLYLQRHAYMLRVAIPYGLLSSAQLRTLAHIARRYDRGFGHFTTRQNIQFNWPRLEDVADILEQLARVEMHAIQTSGNVVRNITSDHLAGVSKDEIEDPRPYCEILRQWSTLHPEFSWLPRKFKIAISGAETDRTASLLHDIGLRLVRNVHGEVGFRVLVGGGMGRTPVIGKTLRPFLEKRHLLSYVEAILRVYNLEGRRDNLHKARIKILVNSLGLEAFKQRVEAEWLRIKDSRLLLQEADVARMQQHFEPPNYDQARTKFPAFSDRFHPGGDFADWFKHNTREHKVAGYRIVYLSLKAPGVPPGDLSDWQMEAVAELADRFSFGEVRATHDQNLVLADVHESDLLVLWKELGALGLATPNIGTLADMICCPGLDYCNLANAGTISVAAQLNERFARLDRLYDLGEVQLKMSGCMNACGHHHAGHIGILGVEKHGEEWYQLTLGGSAGDDAALGQRLGPAVPQHQVAETLDRVLRVYLEQRRAGERFLSTYNRIGIEPFRARVYGDHKRQSGGGRPLVACA